MKEKIKELSDKLWSVHPKDIDAMGLKTRKEFYEHELQLFAQQVIKEYSNFLEKNDLAGSAVINLAEKHFQEKMK